MDGVMNGIRILEVAEHTFVPAASAVLADWGADVVKVEHVTRGDAMRGLMATGVMNFGDPDAPHVLLEHSNRGKRSIGLDLSTEEGVEILYKLAKHADVFLTNKLPKVLKALKIEVEDIRKHNPNIIYVRGTGYGPLGPDADRGGYDILGYWCRSGLAVANTPPELVDRINAQPGPAYGDSIGAMTIAGGISAALLHRERTGEAKVVDVSLMATGMWAMGAGIALSLQMGFPFKQTPPNRSMLRNPLVGGYRTKDSRFIFFSCLQAFQYWPDMCRVLGRQELVTDERFNSHENLMQNALAAAEILDAEFAAKDFNEWKSILSDFKGQWAPVQDSLEVVQDPQTVANGYVVQSTNAQGKPYSLVATPVQFDGKPSQPRRAPEFNEHGDEILTDLLGMEWDSVVDLKVKGVVA